MRGSVHGMMHSLNGKKMGMTVEGKEERVRRGLGRTIRS